MKTKWMRSKVYNQILKFAIVGAINTAIDIAVLNLLIFATGRGSSGLLYSVFKIISFIVAVTNSYFMNKFWTFAGSLKRKAHIEIPQFFFISGIGLLVNVVIASAVVNYFHPMAGLQKLWPTVGALAGTALGLVWNFLGYKYIVFVEHHDASTELLPPV